MSFDLEERTEKFGKDIINICKILKRSLITVPLIKQLLRSGTSVGANYCEANNAVSRKDFINRIGIVKKEAKETVYWLDLLLEATDDEEDLLRKLRQEAQELCFIFNAIFLSSKDNNKTFIEN